MDEQEYDLTVPANRKSNRRAVTPKAETLTWYVVPSAGESQGNINAKPITAIKSDFL